MASSEVKFPAEVATKIDMTTAEITST
uniref:Uncharacterized protein n=1 Tax=Rhizophora mucronata TaxID=61149 RepID=A0A2P2JLZ4_RHIMU